MAQLVIIAATFLAVGVAVLAPLRAAFVTLMLTLALVPPTLNLPNGITSQLLVERVLVGAVAVGLVVRWRRSELPDNIGPSTPLNWPLFFFAAVALGSGVALATPGLPLTSSIAHWVQLVEPLVLFAVVVVAARAIGDLAWVSKVVVGSFSITALIGLGERLTGKRLTSIAPKLFPPIISTNLSVRGGEFRPTATFDYPQSLGIVLACVVPLALVIAAKSRRKSIWTFAPLLLAAVALLTISRSAVLILAIGVPLFALLAWHRVILRLTLVLLAVFAIGYVALPHLRHAFSAPGTSGTITVRQQRVPVVAQMVTGRPWIGLGLGGLDASVPATDDQYVRTYGELGILGLCAAGFLWLGAVAASAWGLSRARPERLWAAAAVAGLVMALVAAESIDLFALGTTRTFWILAAIGVVAADRRAPAARAWRWRWTGVRVPAFAASAAAVCALGVVGTVAGLTFPEHHVARFVFQTWSPRNAAVSLASGYGINEPEEATVCAVVSHVFAGRPEMAASCRFPDGSAGTGIIRVSYRGKQAFQAVMDRLNSATQALPGFSLQLLSDGPARPTPARTAGLWLSFVALFLVWVPKFRAAEVPLLA